MRRVENLAFIGNESYVDVRDIDVAIADELLFQRLRRNTESDEVRLGKCEIIKRDPIAPKAVLVQDALALQYGELPCRISELRQRIKRALGLPYGPFPSPPETWLERMQMRFAKFDARD